MTRYVWSFDLLQFDSAENSQLLERAAMWLKMLRDKHPHHNYTVREYMTVSLLYGGVEERGA